MRTIIYWLLIFISAYSPLFGCAPKTFSIGKGVSVKEIKIRPSESVYKIERYV